MKALQVNDGWPPIADRRVQEIIEFLQKTQYRTVRIQDLAKGIGLSPSRLAHLFKRETRQSIREFVLEKRLLEAARLLASTEKRISAICYSVGFSDVSNFNHAFKRSFGMSPREARRRRAHPSRSLTKISTINQEIADDTNSSVLQTADPAFKLERRKYLGTGS
jgi:AraC-like DNA-binding protein